MLILKYTLIHIYYNLNKSYEWKLKKKLSIKKRNLFFDVNKKSIIKYFSYIFLLFYNYFLITNI